MLQLLKKLDKINFNAYNDKKLTSQDGWAVSYSINLAETHGICESMFQVVVRVSYKDGLVMHYGCITSEETNQFGLWLLGKKSNAHSLEYNERRQNEDIGKAIFSKL